MYDNLRDEEILELLDSFNKFCNKNKIENPDPSFMLYYLDMHYLIDRKRCLKFFEILKKLK